MAQELQKKTLPAGGSVVADVGSQVGSEFEENDNDIDVGDGVDEDDELCVCTLFQMSMLTVKTRRRRRMLTWPLLECSFRLPCALSERLPCGEDKARPAGPNNSTFLLKIFKLPLKYFLFYNKKMTCYPVRDSTVRDFPTRDLSLPAWST